jgi:tetratricopeptide (TPR) repeat protein
LNDPREVAYRRYSAGKGRMSEQHSVKQMIARGVSALERDDYPGALAEFRRVLSSRPDFPDIRNRAGLCLAMMGDMENALIEFDHAVRLNPSYAEAHLNRAIVLNELGQFEEARSAFARAGELERRWADPFPSNVVNRIAVAHASLGDLYLLTDRPKRAAEEFRNALEVRPGFPDIRCKLAEAYMELEEDEKARQELEGVLKRRPGYTEARLRLGVVLHRLKDDAGAIREWTRCARENPGDRRARAYLASLGIDHDGGDQGA